MASEFIYQGAFTGEPPVRWLLLILLLVTADATADAEPLKPNTPNQGASQTPNSVCVPTSEMSKALVKLGESRQGTGVAGTENNKLIVTHWASPSGSWTFTVSGANGITCMVAWGQYWRSTGGI